MGVAGGVDEAGALLSGEHFGLDVVQARHLKMELCGRLPRTQPLLTPKLMMSRKSSQDVLDGPGFLPRLGEPDAQGIHVMGAVFFRVAAGKVPHIVLIAVLGRDNALEVWLIDLVCLPKSGDGPASGKAASCSRRMRRRSVLGRLMPFTCCSRILAVVMRSDSRPTFSSIFCRPADT